MPVSGHGQTGNCLYFAISVAEQIRGDGEFGSSAVNVYCIVCNLIGVAFYELMRTRWCPMNVFSACSPIILASFVFADIIAALHDWSWSSDDVRWVLGPIAFSLGILNSGSAPGPGSSLKVMTGE